MEAGNPKQVAALSVVAVVAVGFLVTRMKGSDLPKMAQAMVDKATGHAAVAPPAFPMVSDPFSHPKLAVTQSDGTSSGSGVTGTGPATPPYLAGTLPPPSGPLAGNEPTGEIGDLKTEPLKPSDPTKGSTVAVVPEGTEVMLEGTAGATDVVAFLSINGAESQPFHPNDLINTKSTKGKVRLLRVEDGAAIFSGPKGELTINVGERKRI